MKVVKETGLVPVTFDVPWGRYSVGDTGGVRPADVAPILKGGFGKLTSIGKDVETFDMKDEDILSDLRADSLPSKLDRALERQGAVEIPDDWRGLHHLVRLKIAAQIKGASVPSAELADATINDELARRGRAETVLDRTVAYRGNIENQAKDGGPSIPPVSGGPVAA